MGNLGTPCNGLDEGQPPSHLSEEMQGSFNIPQVKGGSDHIRLRINDAFQKVLVVQIFVFGCQETSLVGLPSSFFKGVQKIKSCDGQIFPGSAAFVIKTRELKKQNSRSFGFHGV